MEKITLSAEERKSEERADYLRRDGFVVAECYGAGEKNLSLKIPYQEFRRAYIKGGESTVFELSVAGKTYSVLVKELQFHPTTEKIMHADLEFVDMKKPIVAAINLAFEGEAPAVKDGGILMHNKESISIKCLPTDLVHEITVDLSVLTEIGTSIKVADVNLPKGLELHEDGEQPVVSIVAPVEEKEVVAEEGEEGAEGEAPAEEAKAE